MIDKKDEGRDDNSEKVESSSPNILKLRTDFIRRFVYDTLTRQHGPIPCPLCQEEPYIPDEMKDKLWNKYELVNKHLANVAVGGIYPPSSTAYHAPRSALGRYLSEVQGMEVHGNQSKRTSNLLLSMSLTRS